MQHYEWGGFDSIPKLLAHPHPSPVPCAELWLGSHTAGPAQAQIDQSSTPLPELIAANPTTFLGESVALRFQGQLPYLFKVLDVRKMLSIQAHPTWDRRRRGLMPKKRPVCRSHP